MLGICRLEEQHVSFDLETSSAAQTEFFKKQAWKFEVANFARTYVALNQSDSSHFLEGFFSICMARVLVSDLPAQHATDPPNRMMPVALLAQLGRHQRSRKGFGAELLGNALRLIVDLAEQIGCAGVILHTDQDKLVAYYSQFGFEVFKTQSGMRSMFLALRDLVANIDRSTHQRQ